MKKKKPVVVTIPDVREAPARELHARPSASVPYPSAGELLASSSEWARWLEGAFQSVLRPAVLAGAVGLAASGCAFEAEPPPPRGAEGNQDSGAVMFPIPSPSSPGIPPGDTHPPHPTQGGGSGTVVVSPSPDPPPVDGTHASVGPKPPVIPQPLTPVVRGRIRPVHPAIPAPGMIRPVE